MSWYKQIKSNRSLEEYIKDPDPENPNDDWETLHLPSDIKAITYEMWEMKVNPNIPKQDLEEKFEEALSKLVERGGNISQWKSKKKDKKYMEKLRRGVTKGYHKHYKQIQDSSEGALPINLPQPKDPGGPPAGGGLM